MSFVVPIRGVRPSPRDDGIKWVQAAIEEAGVTATTGEPSGGFIQVEVFPIADYADAANPPVLNITTDQATQLPGWYRVRFNDSVTGVEYTAPLYFSALSVRPSTKMVANFIDNRTVDDNNNYVHDFTATTVVTKDTVEGLISTAEQFVLRQLDVDPNVPLPTETQAGVSNIIALYTAMLVELTKFSEQIQNNRSPYPHLKELYDALWPGIVKDVTGESPSGGSGGSGSTSVWDLVATQGMTASYAFPDVPDRITWETRT